MEICFLENPRDLVERILEKASQEVLVPPMG